MQYSMDVNTNIDQTRVTSLERTFCTNFTCCSLELPDLHALFQHYAVSPAHTNLPLRLRIPVAPTPPLEYSTLSPPLSPSSSQASTPPLSPSSTPTSPYHPSSHIAHSLWPSPTESYHDLKPYDDDPQYGCGFGYDFPDPAPSEDLEYPTYEQCYRTFSTSLSAPAPTDPSPKLSALFSDPSYSSLSPISTSPSSPCPSPPPPPAYTPTRRNVTTCPKPPKKGSFKPSGSEPTTAGKTKKLAGGSKPKPGSKSKKGSGSSALGSGRGERLSFGSGRKKSFVCPTKGCTKAYLNPNGLKYHLEKGTCKIEIEVEVEEEEEEEEEPVGGVTDDIAMEDGEVENVQHNQDSTSTSIPLISPASSPSPPSPLSSSSCPTPPPLHPQQQQQLKITIPLQHQHPYTQLPYHHNPYQYQHYPQAPMWYACAPRPNLHDGSGLCKNESGSGSEVNVEVLNEQEGERDMEIDDS